MAMRGAAARTAETVPTPSVDGDFYRIADLLDEKERALTRRVRDFMETEVAPVIEDYWARDTFPFVRDHSGRARGIANWGEEV